MTMFTTNGNRRKAAAAVRLSVLVRAGLLAALIGATGLGYVWQKNQIYEIGNGIRQREKELDILQKKQAILQVQLAELKSPRALWEKCQRWSLGLIAPRDAQVVRLSEPVSHPVFQPIWIAETPRSSSVRTKEVAHNRRIPRDGGGAKSEPKS